MEAKSCCACLRILSADKFGINRAKPSGLSSRCRECAKPMERQAAARMRERHGDKINARVSAYNKAHADRKRAQVRAWEKANPEKARLLNQRRSKKAQQDPVKRACNAVRLGVRRTLRGLKSGKTFDLLGFSPDELRAHLERQFVKGMSWHNAREWHIDHIMPLASFNITGPHDPEFKRAWALTNLRPLWAKDNLQKGARIISLL